MGETSNGWIVRSRADFFDASVNPLSDQAKCLFLLLEGHARHRPFCYPRNTTLARMAGKSERAVRGVLSTLEEAGWILRMMVPGKKSDRQGIILLRRSDPSMRAANTPELIEKAKYELFKERSGPSLSRQNPSASAGNFLPHNKDKWNYTTAIDGVEGNAEARPPIDLFADMEPEDLQAMMLGIEQHPNDSPLDLTTSRTTEADPGVERSAAYQETVGHIRARRIRREDDQRIRTEVVENARFRCRIAGLAEALTEAHMQGVREALDRELAPEDRGGPYLPTA